MLWLGCRCCRPSVNTICGRIMIGLSLSSVSKQNRYQDITGPGHLGTEHMSHLGIRYWTSRYSVLDISVLVWLVVLWLGCRCLPSVNTICGRIVIGLSLSSVSKHNMWSCYDWVFVVVVRQLTQYVVELWLGCRCLPSVNTICGRIMIGLSLLSSVSKHNMWSNYDWVVVVVVCQ